MMPAKVPRVNAQPGPRNLESLSLKPMDGVRQSARATPLRVKVTVLLPKQAPSPGHSHISHAITRG